MVAQELPVCFQPAPAAISRSALYLNCDIGQTAYNAGWRQWTGSVARFRSVWVAGFASLWVAGLSSIRTALPRNHLARSPPCHPPGCRAKAHDSGTTRISGFGSRPEPGRRRSSAIRPASLSASVSQPWQRKEPRVLPRRRRKAFTHLCVPRGCRTHFRSQISHLLRRILIAQASMPSLVAVAGQLGVGRNSDDHRCCKNCAGCSLAGLWQRTDHCGYFLNGIRDVPAQPVAKAAKIARRMSAMLPHIRFAGRTLDREMMRRPVSNAPGFSALVNEPGRNNTAVFAMPGTSSVRAV